MMMAKEETPMENSNLRALPLAVLVNRSNSSSLLFFAALLLLLLLLLLCRHGLQIRKEWISPCPSPCPSRLELGPCSSPPSSSSLPPRFVSICTLPTPNASLKSSLLKALSSLTTASSQRTPPISLSGYVPISPYPSLGSVSFSLSLSLSLIPCLCCVLCHGFSLCVFLRL